MEMATAVVGLVGVGAQISLLLSQFISGCVNAPALVRTIHHEINDFNSILPLLQHVLLGSPLNQSRASMIYVDHLTLILTGCVCTLSEMEIEVNSLKPNGKMRIWDRLKWSRMESTISQLSQRLLSHKSSLTLILTILASPSLTEAIECSTVLHRQLPMPSPSRSGSTLAISGDHATNTGSSSTAAGPGSAVGDSGSTVDNTDTDVDGSESIMTVTRVVNFYRLTCESILFMTRPYRGRSNGSVISLASSQRPKPSWSLISGGSNRSVLSLPVSAYGFSGISLAEASDMSTLPLPISTDKLRNPRWYGGDTTDTMPPRLIPTHNRDGSLELFESKSLHYIAELGLITLVGIWLEQGADIEAKDEGGNTALHIAAGNNRVLIVGLLLGQGADIEAKAQNGETPLHNASSNGHDSTIGLLLDRGADVEAKCQNGFTPLHHASLNGHDSTVGLLLDQGADVEAQSHKRVTPLHNASSNGHDSTVGLLLDQGADVEAKCQNGFTPLHDASRNGHDSTAGLLLDRGADMEAQIQNGETPLHNASFNGHDSTVGLLLDRGADVGAKCHNGVTPLHNASSNGHDLVVGLLLDRGADLGAKSRNGFTPLHSALWNHHDSTVGLLLNRGVDKQAKTQSGKPHPISRDPETIYQLLQEDIL